MPPFVAQKRLRHPSANDQLDSHAKKPRLCRSPERSHRLEENEAFVQRLEETESTLSDIESDEFEDIVLAPRNTPGRNGGSSDDDGEADWEDAMGGGSTGFRNEAAQLSSAKDFQLTLGNHDDHLPGIQASDRAGPTKRQRRARIATHKMHVQYLLFHNLIRNGWSCDRETQRILQTQLPKTIASEVDRWRQACGSAADGVSRHVVAMRTGRRGRRTRNQRDWNDPAEITDNGEVDSSRSDPTLRLLKVLAVYWKERFVIIAPGLRKQGYKPLTDLRRDIFAWRDAPLDKPSNGECIDSLEAFRHCARVCEGSKDIGEQLFTALIRGIGLDARLVASLQPLGFGWSKAEVAGPAKSKARDLSDGNSALASKSLPTKVQWSQSTPVARKGRVDEEVKAQLSTSEGGSMGAPILLEGNSEIQCPRASSPAGDEDSADDDSVVDITPSTPRRKANKHFDEDMPAPTYWTEIISSIRHQIIPVDPFRNIVATNAEHHLQFEPRGKRAELAKQVMAYVIAYSVDGSAKDVTTRYIKRRQWPGVTKGFRLHEKIPSSVSRTHEQRQRDWFGQVMRGYQKSLAHRTATDDREDAQDLLPLRPTPKAVALTEESLQGYKKSHEYVLERHLRREEALRPGSKPVKFFRDEAVFLRNCVEQNCKTAESWHKEGRKIKESQTPYKEVKVRAVTAQRRREVEEAERSGASLMQGIYAKEQTEWIIPPPIVGGLIPKNNFGNIDCFVPSMVPQGAIHIPLRGSVKVCKRLNIDYAEAVTGFDFGNRTAIPVLSGVVIAEEHEASFMQSWRDDEEERRIREEGKREKAALALWRKWLLGIRVLHRMEAEYGRHSRTCIPDDSNPFTNIKKAKSVKPALETRECENLAASNTPDRHDWIANAGGFLVDDDAPKEVRGALTIDDSNKRAELPSPPEIPRMGLKAHNEGCEHNRAKSSMTNMGPAGIHQNPAKDDMENLSKETFRRKKGGGRPSRLVITEKTEPRSANASKLPIQSSEENPGQRHAPNSTKRTRATRSQKPQM